MKPWIDNLLVVLIIGVVVGVVGFLGWAVWDGVSAEQEHQGYCEALDARYYSGNGPWGLCIKDNKVIKEWK